MRAILYSEGEIVRDKKIAYFIDDDLDFLRSVTDLVEHPNYDVETCYVLNGYKIVDDIIKKKPDILFIDFNLPRANGSQVISVLRSINEFKELPVYFMTGYSKEAVSSYMNHLHFEGILDKCDHFVEETLRILEHTSGTTHQAA